MSAELSSGDHSGVLSYQVSDVPNNLIQQVPHGATSLPLQSSFGNPQDQNPYGGQYVNSQLTHVFVDHSGYDHDEYENAETEALSGALMPLPIHTPSFPKKKKRGLSALKDKRSKKSKREIPQKTCQGCGINIKSRNWCSKCNKRKTRNGGVYPNPQEIRKPGRPAKSILIHSNPTQKFIQLENKIAEIAGGKDEANTLLKEYFCSSRWQKQTEVPVTQDIYARIGKSVCSFLETLPPCSPFRKPMLSAMGQNVTSAELKQVVPFGARTIQNSKHLDPAQNPLLTTKCKPHEKRKNGLNGLNEDGSLNELDLVTSLSGGPTNLVVNQAGNLVGTIQPNDLAAQVQQVTHHGLSISTLLQPQIQTTVPHLFQQ